MKPPKGRMPNDVRFQPDIPGPLPKYPRQEQVRIYALAGYLNAQIARKVGLTRERVRQIRRDMEKTFRGRAV